MLRAIAPVIACAAMLAIVACGGRDPVAKDANKVAGLPVSDKSGPDATGAPPAKAAPLPSPAATNDEGIPAVLQGRWGLTPMDCTSTRGDAKGLLIVGADNLKFYESRAVPGQNAQTGTDSISGDFHFTGEGQTWTKFEALELKRDKLVRTESNPLASFTYARCK